MSVKGEPILTTCLHRVRMACPWRAELPTDPFIDSCMPFVSFEPLGAVALSMIISHRIISLFHPERIALPLLPLPQRLNS